MRHQRNGQPVVGIVLMCLPPAPKSVPSVGFLNLGNEDLRPGGGHTTVLDDWLWAGDVIKSTPYSWGTHTCHIARRYLATIPRPTISPSIIAQSAWVTSALMWICGDYFIAVTTAISVPPQYFIPLANQSTNSTVSRSWLIAACLSRSVSSGLITTQNASS